MDIMVGILIGIGFWLSCTISASFILKEVTGFKDRSLVSKPYAEGPRQVALIKLLLRIVFI